MFQLDVTGQRTAQYQEWDPESKPPKGRDGWKGPRKLWAVGLGVGCQELRGVCPRGAERDICPGPELTKDLIFRLSILFPSYIIWNHKDPQTVLREKCFHYLTLFPIARLYYSWYTVK